MSFLCGSGGMDSAYAQVIPSADNPAKPTSVVKLIFIHHSTGMNWLTDGDGNLGRTLGANNYFVSDTDYVWGPDSIGDRTDIPNWLEWFRGPHTTAYMNALFAWSEHNSYYTRSLGDPGGQNQIIMFKSCFPNSALAGNPDDPPNGNDPEYTVGHSKYVYNEILKYFKTRPDKLFIVITAPPLIDGTYAANARAFNNWLVFNWLTDNAYPFHNVAVFDFYNVLTATGAHHWWNVNQVKHVVIAGKNTLAYPSGDDHPNPTGSRKATTEFVPLLNVYYNRWKDLDTVVTRTYFSHGAYDGYIRETAADSNSGGSLNSSYTYIKIGDDASNRRFYAFLSFDTAPIPDGAIIASASLKVKYQSKTNDNPMVWSVLRADVRKGNFGASASLQAADFAAPAGLKSAAVFSETLSGGRYIANVSSSGLSYVNKAGPTQFRVRFDQGTDRDHLTDILRFYSGDAGTANRPCLVVVYVVQ